MLFTNVLSKRLCVCRTEFEELIAPYLTRLRNMLTGLLASVGLKVEDVDEVEIVGGSSRVPAVKRVIADVFKRDPKTTMNQDEAVARGFLFFDFP